ncbi:MAG: UvrD-helicase domain-containing protein, partial [Myxococcota bacterium]
MKFAIADTLRRSIDKLDARDQALVKQSVYDFQVDPHHGGTRLHKLEGCDFKSFYVSRSLRIVVHQSKDQFLLCFAAHHKPAYEWASQRRLVVHPSTGAAQIVVIEEIVREVVKEVVRKREVEPPLFAQYEDDYLLALGVPPEWLGAVRTVGESGLEMVLDNLPQEANERLYRLALGEPVPRPVAVSGDPMTHPDARRRFRVLDSQADLERALEYPWDQWLVFLHPDQQQVATGSFAGPARVSGSAGTGKTVVALHRVAHLARGKGKKPILLTTFSRTLAARLNQHLDLLLEPGSKERERVQVMHIHRLARETWAGSFAPLESNTLVEVLEEASRAAPTSDFPVPFLKAEWEAIVDPWGITTFAAYKAAPRKGRGTPLGAKQKQAIWKVFEAALRIVSERGLMTFNQLCYAAAAKVGKGFPYAHVV